MAAPDKAHDFALKQGLGAALQRASLRGRIEVLGVEVPVELWLSSRGLWLVGARTASEGVALDLLEPGALGYGIGKTSDRIVVRGSAFQTVPGKSKKARESVALGRLGLGAVQGWHGQAFPAKESRLVRGLDAVTLTLLSRLLEPGETLAAWVPSNTGVKLESALGGTAPARFYWLVSDRRQALVGVGVLGDKVCFEFDAHGCRLERGRLLFSGSEKVPSGSFTQSTLVAEQLLELVRLEGKERLAAAAFIEARAGHVAWAERLLKAALPEVPTAAFALEILASDSKRAAPALDLEASLRELRRVDAPAELIADLVRRWEGSRQAGSLLLGKLRAFGALAEPWALELHRSLQGERPQVASTLAFAEHLLEAGHPEQVLGLLGSNPLPPDAAIDKALAEPPPRKALGKLVRTHDLVARAAAAVDADRLPATLLLARLEPLSTPRVRALAEVASGELRSRALEVLAVLASRAPALPNAQSKAQSNAHSDPRLNAPRSSELPPPPARPLSPELLGLRLPHSAGKKTLGPGTLQAVLATSRGPDRETLRSWCERLAPDRHPHAAKAAERARLLLGLPAPELFVSRGEKSLGVRAFGGSVPLVVIGGAHLDPSSPQRLDERELGFAIGAELAHVYYGHERATPREVWRGAVGKARIGLELALTALPLAKGIDLGARATKILDKVPTRALERALGLFVDLEGNMKQTALATNELSARHEDLVPAHRAQQLTADRFGLVVAGSIEPALSGLFRLRSDHQALFASIAEQGIENAARGVLLDHPDLLLRIESLVSFYLGADAVFFASGDGGVVAPGETIA